MRCLECGADFDEMNESQPVCPGCGAVPRYRRDGADICALLEDAAAMIASAESDCGADQGLDCLAEQFLESINLPVDLQEATNDAEALLEAMGYASFVLTRGKRFFSLPTRRLM